MKKQLSHEQQMSASLRMQLLNMRQMYESSIQEKQGLQAALNSKEVMIGALIQQEGKKGELVLTNKTMENLPPSGHIEYEDSDKPKGVRLVLVVAEIKEEEQEEDDGE